MTALQATAAPAPLGVPAPPPEPAPLGAPAPPPEPAPAGDGPRRARRGRPGYDLDALVAIAIRVFTERGYDGTTMADLADALGITKSTIYHHVSGKQEILSRALDRALDALEAVLADAQAADAPAADRLRAAVRGSVTVLVAELPSVTLLLRVRGNSDVERAALARRRGIDAGLADLVAAAQAEGALRGDLTPALVARLVFGTVNSLVEWYRPRAAAHLPADELADAVARMVFDGLSASAPASAPASASSSAPEG